MTARRSSDLHIKVGRRPISRVDGLLSEFEDEPVLTDEAVRALIAEMVGPKAIARFEDENELDVSYKPEDQPDRYRVNIFMRMGHPGIVMRQIPRNVKSIDELGFSQTLKTFAHQAQGLHRHGGLRVADVSEPDGVRRGRARRQDQQGRRHAHRQQGAQKSFFHRFLPPYTDLP